MKLLAKYNRVNILVTILIFLLGNVAFYCMLRFILMRQLDKTLHGEEQEIEGYVQQHRQLPDIQNTKEQWITIQQTNYPPAKPFIKSSLQFNEHKQEDEWIRQLIFPLAIEAKSYTITVSKSQMETEDMIQIIIALTISMIGLILLANYIVNRKVISRTWMSFYATIASIKTYRASSKQPLQLPKDKVDEFSILNTGLNEMTARIHHDYSTLKTFTENAAHEMQTPVAVIRSKIDVLLQNNLWDEKSAEQLLGIEQSINKLAKLHQSLLLLARLENRQFVTNEEIRFDKILEDKIAEKTDLLHSKEIELYKDIKETVLLFHPHLAEILVNNLLSNVIRYTPKGGRINVELSPGFFSVSNTAVNGALDENKIFQRFYKRSENAEGTGLGLAIVNEICSIAGFPIQYRYHDKLHQFTIQFSNENKL